eukprot:scaffold296889_cov26-Tisochrysis_lutea.AAC.2
MEIMRTLSPAAAARPPQRRPMTSSHSIDTTGRRSGFGTADRFNCASGARGAEPLSPGPAAYDVKMSSVGGAPAALGRSGFVFGPMPPKSRTLP